MQILFVHKHFPGQFPYLAAALAQDPVNRVVFIAAEGSGAIEGVERLEIRPKRRSEPSTHHYVQAFENAVLYGQAAYRTADELARRGFRPDVICAHAGFGPGLYLRDAFRSCPIIGYFEWYYRARGSDVDYLDPARPTPDDELRVRTRNAGLLLELESCDLGLTPTHYQRDQFPREYRKKLTVLYDGVDTEWFRPTRGDRGGVVLPAVTIPIDAEIVTFATRGLEPYRGFPQFMRALAQILPRRERLHAVIVGNDQAYYGPRSPDGRGFREILLDELPALRSPRVHFTGPLPREAHLRVLQASHVHVYLTVPFVLSWSLLESMATGCAIVGSDTPPVREIVEHEKTGILVDMRDPQAIASAIERLLDDRALARRIGTAACAHAKRRYALSRLLPRQITLLRGIAAGTENNI